MLEPTIEGQLVSELQARAYDHHVRLVYADWLDERGDELRATVLRFDAGVFGWSPSVDTALAQVDATWRAAVDPRAARRDPLWVAAALGGEPEGAQLGELAPPLLGEPATTTADALHGWPEDVLARLAATAAHHALDAAQGELTEDSAAQCRRLLERTLAQRPLADHDVTMASADATQLLLDVGDSRIRAAAFEALGCALRSCGRPSGPHDRRVAEAASRAIQATARTRVAVAWATNGLDKQHDQVRALARHAQRAARRAREWRHHSRRAAKRKADIATASLQAQAAYQRARATCPPPPARDVLTRDVIAIVAVRVLGWLRTRA